MTAEDVLFSYELFRDQGLPSFRVVLPQTIASAEVVDEDTIRFTFTEDAPDAEPHRERGRPLHPSEGLVREGAIASTRAGWSPPSARGPTSSTAMTWDSRSSIAATPTTGG